MLIKTAEGFNLVGWSAIALPLLLASQELEDVHGHIQARTCLPLAGCVLTRQEIALDKHLLSFFETPSQIVCTEKALQRG
jgi:hypothetical protein